MNLHEGAGHRNRLQLDPPELFLLEVGEHPVKDTGLRPAIHPGVDGRPPPEPGRSSSPLAPMLGDVQDGIEHVPVRDAHVAWLHR